MPGHGRNPHRHECIHRRRLGGGVHPAGMKPADYLTYYATKFDTMEVDSTFYRTPSTSTVSRVSESVDFFLERLQLQPVSSLNTFGSEWCAARHKKGIQGASAPNLQSSTRRELVRGHLRKLVRSSQSVRLCVNRCRYQFVKWAWYVISMYLLLSARSNTSFAFRTTIRAAISSDHFRRHCHQ